MSIRNLFNSNMKSSIVLAIGLLLFPSVANAQSTASITIRVDGLSCAFCAYSLEKNLKELKGVDDVEINLNKGTATLVLGEGKDVSDEVINKTVEDAGFSPRSINRPEKQKGPRGQAVLQ